MCGERGGAGGRGAPNRTGKKQSVTQPWPVCCRETCNVMPLGGCGAAQPGLSGQQKGREASPLPRPKSAVQGRHLTGLRKPRSSASSASGAQSDLCKSLSSQGLSFPTGPKYTRTLARGSVDSYPSWALYCPLVDKLMHAFLSSQVRTCRITPPQS